MPTEKLMTKKYLINNRSWSINFKRDILFCINKLGQIAYYCLNVDKNYLDYSTAKRNE